MAKPKSTRGASPPSAGRQARKTVFPLDPVTTEEGQWGDPWPPLRLDGLDDIIQSIGERMYQIGRDLRRAERRRAAKRSGRTRRSLPGCLRAPHRRSM